MKKLFRLVIYADAEKFLAPYEKEAESGMHDLEAYETRVDEKGKKRQFEFVIETFDEDVWKHYRDLADTDKHIMKYQKRIRTFKTGKM